MVSSNADIAFHLGDDQQIDALKEVLDTESIFARKLATGVAYHSPHMQQIADNYLSAMGSLELGDQLMGCQAMVSSVSTFQGRFPSPPKLFEILHPTKNHLSYVLLQSFDIGGVTLCGSQILRNVDAKAELTPRLSSGDKPKRDIQRA